MGIFDLFKKNNSSQLNLSNPAIKKMVKWIAHPMEFNKLPDSAEIFDERELFWPSQKMEKCYLIKFVVDGEEYIGFTGPITWCFFAIDFSKMTIQSLYEAYCGWFITFATVNDDNYDKTKEGYNREIIDEDLEDEGYSNITLRQNVVIAGENYYDFLAEKDGVKYQVVGTQGAMVAHDMSYILPLYDYIGVAWNPLEV